MHLKHHYEGVHYLRAHIQKNCRSTLCSIHFNCVLCKKKCNFSTTHDAGSSIWSTPESSVHKRGFWLLRVFYVTIHGSSEKKLAILFTSLTTRALHVEIAHSTDKNTFVMGIERFMARRVKPSLIWSDNGTNLIAAEKELLACLLSWATTLIASNLAYKGKEWKFNPTARPHHGVVWERIVRSFKRTLNSIPANCRITDEVLQTAFCLVEQTLNNRPRTTVSSNNNNFDA